jgi:hypothetical protein
MTDFTVDAGDCISSIAASNGFYWETIWNHPQNADLKQKRKDPNILLSGDVVFVPDKQQKKESRSAGQNYKFVKKNNVVTLRIRLQNEFKARHGLKYTLLIGGLTLNGTTDGEGIIEKKVPVSATDALLTTDEDAYNLSIGTLGPIDENLGVQHRLQNLGYLPDDTEGQITEATTAAITRFQKEHGLQADGNLTDATRNKVKEVHGC